MNQLMMKVFVEQPLASHGSANYDIKILDFFICFVFSQQKIVVGIAG